MDPLTVLRQYVMDGQLGNVVTAGDRINFGDKYSFPRNSYTAFRQAGGDFYQLEALLLFAEVILRDKGNMGEYVQRARAGDNKIQVVNVVDRQVSCRTCMSSQVLVGCMCPSIGCNGEMGLEGLISSWNHASFGYLVAFRLVCVP